ncbi:MAG: dipeptidase [Candidatus Kapaibacteriales bacterium]
MKNPYPDFHIADAHCDTLTAFPGNSFASKEAHWNAKDFIRQGGDLQIFAIFTPPEYQGNAATAFATKAIGDFHNQVSHGAKKDAEFSNINHVTTAEHLDSENLKILLSIEGATPLQDSLVYLHAFYQMGVRAVGLTWNHKNSVASGADHETGGITDYGKEFLAEMERLKMVIDVSHLNIEGFEDTVIAVEGPFIASHSNARSIREHRRNLHDWQIEEIIQRKGFVGLNFHFDFVDGKLPTKGVGNNKLEEYIKRSEKSLLKHAEHILSLGGEDVLGFGGDLDGIKNGTYLDVFGYQRFIKLLKEDLSLSDTLIEKIAGANLKRAIRLILR